jgi:hypothetical protein
MQRGHAKSGETGEGVSKAALGALLRQTAFAPLGPRRGSCESSTTGAGLAGFSLAARLILTHSSGRELKQ